SQAGQRRREESPPAMHPSCEALLGDQRSFLIIFFSSSRVVLISRTSRSNRSMRSSRTWLASSLAGYGGAHVLRASPATAHWIFLPVSRSATASISFQPEKRGLSMYRRMRFVLKFTFTGISETPEPASAAVGSSPAQTSTSSPLDLKAVTRVRAP